MVCGGKRVTSSLSYTPEKYILVRQIVILRRALYKKKKKSRNIEIGKAFFLLLLYFLSKCFAILFFTFLNLFDLTFRSSPTLTLPPPSFSILFPSLSPSLMMANFSKSVVGKRVSSLLRSCCFRRYF